jgi:hypothetical protein
MQFEPDHHHLLNIASQINKQQALVALGFS